VVLASGRGTSGRGVWIEIDSEGNCPIPPTRRMETVDPACLTRIYKKTTHLRY
jgi:hypothetical protein